MFYFKTYIFYLCIFKTKNIKYIKIETLKPSEKLGFLIELKLN
jgi:hypothetical protein